MMVFDFQPDPTEIARARRAGLARRTFPDIGLDTDYFWMPVHIQVDGKDMLGTGQSGVSPVAAITIDRGADPRSAETPWQKLPILHVATTGRWCLRQAIRHGCYDYGVPWGGYLSFQCDEEAMVVYSRLTGMTGRVPAAGLYQAWTEFDRLVGTYVLTELPELRDHPEFGAWLRGEDDYPVGWP